MARNTPEISALSAIHNVQTELERLRTEMAALREELPTSGKRGRGSGRAPPTLVTLNQIGALVHRSKRTMERYRSRMPPPRVRGRRGQPQLWDWSEVRPWLESTFGARLPEHFPGSAA